MLWRPRSDDPAFRPEHVTQATVHEWVEAVRTMAGKTLDSLERALPRLDAEVRTRPKACWRGVKS